MKLLIAQETPQVDALAVICFEAENGGAVNDPSIAAQNGWIADLRSTGEFTGKLYDMVTLYRPEGVPAKRLVVIGGGKASAFSSVEARRAAGALVRVLRPRGVKTIAVSLEAAQATPEHVAAMAEGAIAGVWEPDKYKSDPKKNDKQIENFVIAVPKSNGLAEALERGRIIGEAQNFTRDLINEPANKLTPAVLAARSKKDGFGQ